MYASNPAKTRKRKPLRDVQPIARLAHQDSTLVLGDRLASPEFRKRYELLKTTVRRVILRGGLFSLMPDDKPSALLNGLIEQATGEGLYLLRRPQVTQKELPFVELFDGELKADVVELSLPAFSDAELVRRAKCLADKIVKSQKIIRRPCKRDEAGNIIRDAQGRPRRGYECVGLRIEHPVKSKDINRELEQGWTSPVDNFVTAMDGRPINGGTTTNYAHAATNEMVNKFQREMLLEVIASHLGQDDAEFLIDYLTGRFPESPVADEMADFFIEQLKPFRDEMEQFRSLLT